jgi:hypothetical protein
MRHNRRLYDVTLYDGSSSSERWWGSAVEVRQENSSFSPFVNQMVDPGRGLWGIASSAITFCRRCAPPPSETTQSTPHPLGLLLS